MIGHSAMQSVWVVIPAFNEDSAVIRPAVESVAALGASIVVVDDGSEVETRKAIEGLPVHYCRHAVNLGQGAALATGISFSLRQGAEYIVTFDSDGQHSAAEISMLLAPIRSGETDVVLGSRFLSQAIQGQVSARKRIVLRMAVAFTKFSTGLKLTDTHNGFRAFSRMAAEKLNITQNRMAHASEILAIIAANDLRYVECPVTITYSDYSVSKGQKMTNAFNILWDLLVSKIGIQ